MTKTLPELQMEFIQEVARCIEVDWERAEVHYEFYVHDGDNLEQSTSVSWAGDKWTDIDLSFDAIEIARAMRSAKPAGQAEHWSSMDFRLDSTGKFAFDYGYGVPPMAARTIAAQPENKGRAS